MKTTTFDVTLEERGIESAMIDAIQTWCAGYMYPDTNAEDANAAANWILEHQVEFENVSDWRLGEVPEYDPNFRQCVYCCDSPAWMWHDHDVLDDATNACHRHQLRYVYESGMCFEYIGVRS